MTDPADAECAQLPLGEHSAAKRRPSLDAPATAVVSSLDEMSYCRLHQPASVDCGAAGQGVTLP